MHINMARRDAISVFNGEKYVRHETHIQWVRAHPDRPNASCRAIAFIVWSFFLSLFFLLISNFVYEKHSNAFIKFYIQFSINKSIISKCCKIVYGNFLFFFCFSNRINMKTFRIAFRLSSSLFEMKWNKWKRHGNWHGTFHWIQEHIFENNVWCVS